MLHHPRCSRGPPCGWRWRLGAGGWFVLCDSGANACWSPPPPVGECAAPVHRYRQVGLAPASPALGHEPAASKIQDKRLHLSIQRARLPTDQASEPTRAFGGAFSGRAGAMSSPRWASSLSASASSPSHAPEPPPFALRPHGPLVPHGAPLLARRRHDEAVREWRYRRGARPRAPETGSWDDELAEERRRRTPSLAARLGARRPPAGNGLTAAAFGVVARERSGLTVSAAGASAGRTLRSTAADFRNSLGLARSLREAPHPAAAAARQRRTTRRAPPRCASANATTTQPRRVRFHLRHLSEEPRVADAVLHRGLQTVDALLEEGARALKLQARALGARSAALLRTGVALRDRDCAALGQRKDGEAEDVIILTSMAASESDVDDGADPAEGGGLLTICALRACETSPKRLLTQRPICPLTATPQRRVRVVTGTPRQNAAMRWPHARREGEDSARRKRQRPTRRRSKPPKRKRLEHRRGGRPHGRGPGCLLCHGMGHTPSVRDGCSTSSEQWSYSQSRHTLSAPRLGDRQTAKKSWLRSKRPLSAQKGQCAPRRAPPGASASRCCSPRGRLGLLMKGTR